MKTDFSTILSARITHILLLVFITAMVFSNTLNNEYHLDSFHRVAKNTEINHFWPPNRFFTDKRTGSTVPQIAEYRPIMPLTHSINSEISRATGTSKLAGFHVGNIVIHTGSVILAYFLFLFLLNQWGKGQASETFVTDNAIRALLASLIFAIHPIAGSAVNYIAARDLLLMVFFFMAFMLTYFRMRRNGDSLAGWLISLLFLSLAILSKQTAIMGFGLIFLFEWILMKVKLSDWRLWARTALVAVPTGAFFLLHIFWISDQDTVGSLRTFDNLSYPFTMLDAHLFYYARNFVWPFEMRALANIDMVTSFSEPSALLGLCFIIMTFLVAWFNRVRQPLITFSILAYWLLFSLTSSIFPFRYVVTDYRQYQPLLFLALVVSMLVYSNKRKYLTLCILSVLIAYFSIAAHHINTHWETEESFWKQSVKYGAVDLAHQNYGLAIAGKNPELAEFHYKEAIRQYPSHIYANINLGMLHIRMGKETEGLQRLRRMVELNPDWALSHYWFSEGLKITGQKEEALKEMLLAADLDARSLKYQYAAARALQNAGKRKEAIPYFERVIEHDPEYELAGFWLGFAYQKTGQSQKAIDTYNNFLAYNTNHVQGNFNLGYELMKNNDCKNAVSFYNKALEQRPSYLEAHRYLSNCYESLGDLQLSQYHIELSRKGKK